MRVVIVLIARVAASIAVLAVILSRVSIEEVLARGAGGAPLLLAAALALSLLGVVLVALRWRLLAGWLGLEVPVGFAVRALFLAVFGGQVLPSALGADILRGWMLARHTSGVARTVASLMADRLVALFAACLLVLLSGGGTKQLLPAYGGLLGPAAALISGGILLAFLLGLRRGMEGVTLQPGPILLAIAIALTVHAGTVAVAAVTARAYAVDSSLELWISVIPLSVIVSALPISLNGWGVREAMIVVLAAPLGLPAAEALLVSLTLGILNMLASLPGALVMLRSRRARLGMILPPSQQ